jgi:hypothetical protein
MRARPPTSVVLNELLGEAPAERVTLGWLMGRLGERSFGLVLLILGLLGLVPGASAFVGVLLAVPALQMILARPGPIFPRRVADRPFPSRQVARVVQRAVPVLRYLEKFVAPRWPTPFKATKRVVGGVVLLLGMGLLAPVPLSNVPPAVLIVLVAFAYLEEDGALLCAGLAASVLLFTVVALAIWRAARVTGWVWGLP